MGEKVLTFLGRGEIWVIGSALVVFLVVTWVLRGAPPGQAAESEEDSDAPRSGYRDRIVAGVVVGLLLILGAAFVALDRGILWSVPIFALGFGLVLTLIRVNRRYRHASPSLRRTIEFSDSFLNLSLLAGILIVINVLAFRYGGYPLDMTREATYSLSSSTLNQLTSLDRPLTFTMIFGRGPVAERQRDRVEQLLESYRDANPRSVRIAHLDPYSDVSRIEELAKRVPDLAMLRGGGVLIEYGEGPEAEAVVVRNQDMFEPISADQLRTGSDRFESAFTGEDAITSALMRRREGKTVKVAFTSGHKEQSINDPGQKGVGNWKARLARVGCDVIELNLVAEEVPEDLTLLIVAGPSRPIPAEGSLQDPGVRGSRRTRDSLAGQRGPVGPRRVPQVEQSRDRQGPGHRPQAELQGQLAVAPRADPRDIASPDRRGDGLESVRGAPHRGADRDPGPDRARGHADRSRRSQPAADGDPPDGPHRLDRDGPQEPPPDLRPFRRRSRARDRRRGGFPATRSATGKVVRPRRSRGWCCSPARRSPRTSSRISPRRTSTC